MNTFELAIRGKRYNFKGPSAWSELTPRQAVVLIRFRERINTSLELVFPLLQLLYGIKPTRLRWLFDESFLVRKKIPEVERFNALASGQALLDTLNWIGETLPGSTFLVPSFRLYDFQFGSVRILMRRARFQTLYYGPAESLSNLNFGEFMYAENAYKAKNWPELAAILYRPGNPQPGQTSDPREAFEADLVDGRTALFTELDPALLTLIVHHYESCKLVLLQYFDNVFSVGSEQNQPQTAPPKASWLNVAINLAKLDVTKVEQIKTVNLYLALQVLDEQIRQAEELAAELQKNKRS